jgi:hypothetical protein
VRQDLGFRAWGLLFVQGIDKCFSKESPKETDINIKHLIDNFT